MSKQFIDPHQAWREEETFSDALYEWMQRAPWLAISAAAHLVIFLVVQAIPWNLFDEEPTVVITAGVHTPPPDPFEDPPPEDPLEDVELPETLDEPVLVDSQDVESETDTDQPFEDDAGDAADSPFSSPLDHNLLNKDLGLGGGAGGLRKGRFGGDKNRLPGGRGTHESLARALRWLADHQDADGKWDADGFMKHDPAGDECDGAGDAKHDVGVTGLALLAFLGDGHTMRHRGPYQDNVLRAVRWLREQQDHETGLIGEPVGHSFLYDHAIATLALCEAYYFGRSPALRGNCQRAVNLISRARNPYGAWRYDLPPTGDQDSSVTGWMVFALKSAKDCGLLVDEDAFVGARNLFLELTDAATGRVGYDTPGSSSSRVRGVNDHFPTDRGEAMTATALLCRVFMGDEPDEPMLRKHADLLRRSLPEWDPEGGACDMYYWYYGTYAMYQFGGQHWKAWNAALKSAALDSQRKDGSAAGSWDPAGPWGMTGGRVYSTAVMGLCLEVYFRYSRVAGAR